MAYKRFLVNNDYFSVLTEEHMKQLIRDKEDRLALAEQSAEMNMLEYLDQYYEIEKELKRGKSILDYSPYVTYPTGIYIKFDGQICKTLDLINGRKLPSSAIYWSIVEDCSGLDYEVIGNYSQLKTYVVGDYVKYGADVWKCELANGYGLSNVRIPGVSAWVEKETAEWEPNYGYEVNSVVSYEGEFYILSTAQTDLTISPSESDCWNMIGEYAQDYDYDFSIDTNDYVVSGGKVYYAVLNPNATIPEIGVNLIREDPRNLNIITHMVRLSVYYLHQLISPNNISESRRWAYEDSMNWLALASKFKLNPQIPRKINKDDGRATTDWAIETFQRNFDPSENPWLI